MKVYELLSFSKELLYNLHSAGLKVTDYQYIEIYNDFVYLKQQNEKITYIVSYLADKYSVSERHIYSIINKLEKTINTEGNVQLISS